MSPLNLFATAAITCALIFYTCGVFGERRARALKPRYVVLFWLGLTYDTIGTLAMSSIANAAHPESTTLSFHAVTGLAAIILMLVHALWATFTAWRGSERAVRIFSRFSIGVWLVWLMPYVCGLLLGIPFIPASTEAAVAIAVCTALAFGGIICLRTNVRKRAHRKGNAHV